MRYRDLFEAPIADLEVGPGPVVTQAGNNRYIPNFGSDDLDILTSDKGRAKIFRAFDKTPFVFNFYVFMGKVHGTGPKSATKDAVEKALGRPIEMEGRITVVYTNNVTNREARMPMNAWTLAHRIIHVLQASSKAPLTLMEREMWRGLVDLATLTTTETFRFFADRTGGIDEFASPSGALTRFSWALFTMKSARDGKLMNSLDPAGELLAQYLLTGKVKFNSAEELVQKVTEITTDSPRYTNYNRTFKLKDRIDLVSVQKRIDELQVLVERDIQAALETMVGKIYIW